MLNEAAIGEVVEIYRLNSGNLLSEIIAVDEHQVTLAPWGDTAGVRVHSTLKVLKDGNYYVSPSSVGGRVLCPLGKDLFSGESFATESRKAPTPTIRDRTTHSVPLATGLRSVDTMLPMIQGQRIGVFAGAGVGKTTLLTQLARQIQADRIVICLIGERSREASAFIDLMRSEKRWSQTTLIVATAEQAPALRVKAAYLAMDLAMKSRDAGEHCLLLFDSLTRWTRARRDLATMAGERPARGGFPPSALSALAPLLENAGATNAGAITSFYTVLLEGDDMDDPVGDEVRGLVEGHWILNRNIAERQIFPAIDLKSSLSRLADDALPRDKMPLMRTLRATWAHLEELNEAEAFGLYNPGTNPLFDTLKRHRHQLHQFQAQGPAEFVSSNQAWAEANALIQTLYPNR